MYASANRDEHEWEDPETFDIRRDAGRHVGFGNGAHACAGQGLARLETTAMLRALLERVDRIEVVGEPVMGAQQHHPPSRAAADQAVPGLTTALTPQR